MLKNSFVILSALIAWATSSLIVALGMPNLASLTDGLDMIGEALFTVGILLMFVRLALNSYRHSVNTRSTIGHTRQS